MEFMQRKNLQKVADSKIYPVVCEQPAERSGRGKAVVAAGNQVPGCSRGCRL